MKSIYDLHEAYLSYEYLKADGLVGKLTLAENELLELVKVYYQIANI